MSTTRDLARYGFVGAVSAGGSDVLHAPAAAVCHSPATYLTLRGNLILKLPARPQQWHLMSLRLRVMNGGTTSRDTPELVERERVRLSALLAAITRRK